MSVGSGVLEFLLLVVLKAGIVAVVAFAWSRVLRRSRAAARHVVWATALTVVLLLPVLSLSVGRVPLPVAIPGWGPNAVTRLVDPGVLTPVGTVGSVADGRARSHTSPRAAKPEESGTHRRPMPWSAVVWALYVAGMLAVALRLGAGMRQAGLIAKRATPIAAHAEWRSTLAMLGRRRSLSRVSLLTSSAIGAPVTFGFLRPVIVLPHDVSSWSARQRRDALVHELAHVDRFDWGFQCLATLACALHWFNPLVWGAARQLQLEAERACDERVIESGASPHDYAEQLVVLTRQCSSAHLPTTIAMSRDSFLAGRVKALLSYRRSGMRSRGVLTIAAVVMTAGGVLLAPLEPTSAARYRAPGDHGDLSPLMQAVAGGDVDGVKRLIAGGADVDERLAGQGTPLILAAASGAMDIARLLIDAGADINRGETKSPRDLMRTPLTEATRRGHVDIARLLVDHGADVDAAPGGDATAIMEAAKNNHPAIVALLIEAGADVRLDIDGDGNAIIAAVRGGNVDIAEMIVGAGADVRAGVPGDGNALIVAVRRGDRRMVEYLLSQGADPTAYVPGDETALVAAAEQGDGRMMRLLLETVKQ